MRGYGPTVHDDLSLKPGGISLCQEIGQNLTSLNKSGRTSTLHRARNYQQMFNPIEGKYWH
jgi:hypothetical protein